MPYFHDDDTPDPPPTREEIQTEIRRQSGRMLWRRLRGKWR